MEAVQVVRVLDDHTYQLDEDALSRILKNELVRSLPVVVVSVAGTFRGGKSCLLNLFLRYLTAPESTRKTDAWLVKGGTELNGFSWRGGCEKNTTGILMWPDPIILTKRNGEKVAVVLVDTQGTFDSSSTVRDNSTIFALSTLISSVQVYNLFRNIIEVDLQHLQQFTEYGLLLQEKVGIAFQKLMFLVRDWPNECEYPYGNQGGKAFLQKRLEVTANQPRELTKLRKRLRSCFENMECFLMPHPGLKLAHQQGCTIDVAALTPEFKLYLKELASSIFDSKNLLTKTIGGHEITASELFVYIKSYMTIFNSNQLPGPVAFIEMMEKASLEAALEEGVAKYRASTLGIRDPSQPALSQSDLKALDLAAAAAAREAFAAKRKNMGFESDIEVEKKYLAALGQRCEAELLQLDALNGAKVRSVEDTARKAYDQSIEKALGARQLCLHPKDLTALHAEAIAAALLVYDAGRQRAQNDGERELLIKSFEKQLSALRSSNEQSNSTMVASLQTEYWERMQTLSGNQPPLSIEIFKMNHEVVLSELLQKFNTARIQLGNHLEDEYKAQLKQNILRYFGIVSAQNSARVASERQRQEDAENSAREQNHLKEQAKDEQIARTRAEAALKEEIAKRDQIQRDAELKHEQMKETLRRALIEQELRVKEENIKRAAEAKLEQLKQDKEEEKDKRVYLEAELREEKNKRVIAEKEAKKANKQAERAEKKEQEKSDGIQIQLFPNLKLKF